MLPHDIRKKAAVRLLKNFLPISIIDVGANPIGEPAAYAWLLAQDAVTLTGFEPQLEALSELKQRASERETYLPYAIGAGRTETLHICRNSGFTSIFRPDQGTSDLLGNTRATRVVDEIPVQTRRLDDLHEVPRADFLKIDIQGGERDAISGGADRLSEAVLIQSEIRLFPLYEDEPKYGDLEAELAKQGFYFHSFTGLKRTTQASRFKSKMRKSSYTQCVDSDAFFVRDLRLVDDYSNVQLSKLAILAECVMECPDLTLFCLDRLCDRGVVSEPQIEAYLSLLPPRMIRK